MLSVGVLALPFRPLYNNNNNDNDFICTKQITMNGNVKH